MSEKIKTLIQAEVSAKLAFQAAQEAVRVAINEAYPADSSGTIETDEEIQGVKVSIRVEKKGDGAQYCSWTKFKVKPSVARDPGVIRTRTGS